MSKTLKSVKIDNDLNEIIETYITLMKSIIGDSPTFTSMVEQGIWLYLLKQLQMLDIVMQNGIIVENGILKELSVNQEQKTKIEELRNEILSFCDDYKMELPNGG